MNWRVRLRNTRYQLLCDGEILKGVVPFSFSGCRSLLVSHWPFALSTLEYRAVPDAPTPYKEASRTVGLNMKSGFLIQPLKDFVFILQNELSYLESGS